MPPFDLTGGKSRPLTYIKVVSQFTIPLEAYLAGLDLGNRRNEDSDIHKYRNVCGLGTPDNPAYPGQVGAIAEAAFAWWARVMASLSVGTKHLYPDNEELELDIRVAVLREDGCTYTLVIRNGDLPDNRILVFLIATPNMMSYTFAGWCRPKDLISKFHLKPQPKETDAEGNIILSADWWIIQPYMLTSIDPKTRKDLICKTVDEYHAKHPNACYTPAYLPRVTDNTELMPL